MSTNQPIAAATDILWNPTGLLKKALRCMESGMLPEKRKQLALLIPKLEGADAANLQLLSRFPFNAAEEACLWERVALLCAEISTLIESPDSYSG